MKKKLLEIIKKAISKKYTRRNFNAFSANFSAQSTNIGECAFFSDCCNCCDDVNCTCFPSNSEPETLIATVFGGADGCECLNDFEVILTYDSESDQWLGNFEGDDECGMGFPVTGVVILTCSNGNWLLQWDCGTDGDAANLICTAENFSLDPVNLIFQELSPSDDDGDNNCCGSADGVGSFSVVVTES